MINREKSAHLIENLNAVMSTLLYFDIFDHPLKKNEITKFIHEVPLSRDEVESGLQILIEESLLFEKMVFTRRLAI